MAKDLTGFFKQNAKKQENIFVDASPRFTETAEDGTEKTLQWELAAINCTKEKKIKKKCYYDVTKTGSNGKKTVAQQFDGDKYTTLMIIDSCVFPDLMNADLQDTYGVKTEWDLINAMLLPGEMAELGNRVSVLNGFDIDTGEKTETVDDLAVEAKNSSTAAITTP